MNDYHEPDWDPRSEQVLHNPLAACDDMRRRCPVAYSEYHQWSLFRHADISRVLLDHKNFSNAVSVHLSVPNGMDPPEHTPYRKLIEPFFDAEPMAAFEPRCRELARELVDALSRRGSTEFISTFAQTFAVKVQCLFLGWPDDMQKLLLEWSLKNQAATLAQDRAVLARVAEEFAGYIYRLLESRRNAGDAAPDDVTTQLLRAQVNGRLLSDDEIVSVLRNWTAGEIGTIAASVGILVHFLAEHPDLQQELRQQPEKLTEAIDEILRIHGPLVSNRRLATCPADIGERHINAGERVSVLWVSANRDEQVFEEPESFRWGRDQSKNLLYGAGIHVCPGAPLARLELRVVMEELLERTKTIELWPETAPVGAVYPASGFSSLHVRVE